MSSVTEAGRKALPYGDDRRYRREPFTRQNERERAERGCREWLHDAASLLGTPDEETVPRELRERLRELHETRQQPEREAQNARQQALPAWVLLWQRAQAGSVIDQLQAAQHRTAMYRRFRGVRAL